MARGVSETTKVAATVPGQARSDELLTLVRGHFEEYADESRNSRKIAEKCRDYRDGNHWTAEERATFKRRKQPCITDNKIADKCDTMLGLEKQLRSDPKAFPRTPEDEQSAEAATDALRFVADQSDYQRSVRKPAADNLMVEGFCAGQVVVEKKKGRPPKILHEHIRWDRAYHDIHALKDDFSDKTYCGYFRWMDVEQARLEWPNVEDTVFEWEQSQSVAGADRSLDDKPRYVMVSRKRKRIQIFKHYFLRGGVWHECVWTRGGWLEEPKPCAYLDEDGQPVCCMELQALYRDSDGHSYGVVQRYLDLQDEHNKRRSKMLHLLTAKRIVTRRGTVQNLKEVREEIHKPDGVVEVDGDPKEFRVEDNLSESQGQWQLLQQTDAALAQTGPNAALLGQTGSISGRAKQLDQQAGTLLVSPLYEALDAFEVRMYRQAWARVKQYWTAEMWIRVTDDEEKVKFVLLNESVTQAHLAAEQLATQQIPDGEKAAMLEQMAADPAMRTPVLGEDGKPKRKNDVARMDVDIIIGQAPDSVNIQQEQFETIATLAQKRPEVPFEAVVEASQLRADAKRRILEKLKGADNPMAQQLAAMQAQMQQLQLTQTQLQSALLAAKVRHESASAAKDEAAAVESHIDAAVKTAQFVAAEGAMQPQASKTTVSVN